MSDTYYEKCCKSQNKHLISNQCIDCDAYGTGYKWDQDLIMCNCVINNCICTSEACCNQIDQTYQSNQCFECSDLYEGSKFENGKCLCDQNQKYVGQPGACIKCSQLVVNGECKSCNDVYGDVAIHIISSSPTAKTCICNPNEWYIGILSDLTSTCQKCPEGINSAGTACVSCKEAYGQGAVLGTEKRCVCDIDQKYVGLLNQPLATCIHCSELVVFGNYDNTCKTCLEHSGIGFIFDIQSNLCKCDESKGFIQVGLKCILCPELLVDGKCLLCKSYDSNAIFVNHACICNSNSITISLSPLQMQMLKPFIMLKNKDANVKVATSVSFQSHV
ncbi:Growth_factor receptor cysteine-rich domain superfamily [Hexamita inflata]|uniref:Growth_factor receptor cysteine-rich domain superfamily n=1 Tax=Hexamita inflata TaxID=28002 RepID=A0ABP1HNQ7_9EUKA